MRRPGTYVCIYIHKHISLSNVLYMISVSCTETWGESWKVNRKSNRLHLYMYKYKFLSSTIWMINSESYYCQKKYTVILLVIALGDRYTSSEKLDIFIRFYQRIKCFLSLYTQENFIFFKVKTNCYYSYCY